MALNLYIYKVEEHIISRVKTFTLSLSFSTLNHWGEKVKTFFLNEPLTSPIGNKCSIVLKARGNTDNFNPELFNRSILE